MVNGSACINQFIIIKCVSLRALKYTHEYKKINIFILFCCFLVHYSLFSWCFALSIYIYTYIYLLQYNEGGLICALQPKGNGVVRTQSTWTLKWWWSPKKARPTPSSWWLHPDRRSQRGQATSARYMSLDEGEFTRTITAKTVGCKHLDTCSILWEKS